jgi:hypothetical protein
MRPGWRRLRLHDHAKGKGLFNPAKLTCQFPKNSARLRCVSPLGHGCRTLTASTIMHD